MEDSCTIAGHPLPPIAEPAARHCLEKEPKMLPSESPGRLDRLVRTPLARRPDLGDALRTGGPTREGGARPRTWSGPHT